MKNRQSVLFPHPSCKTGGSVRSPIPVLLVTGRAEHSPECCSGTHFRAFPMFKVGMVMEWDCPRLQDILEGQVPVAVSTDNELLCS